MEKIKFNNGWKVWKDLDPFELVFHVPEDAAEVDLPYDAMFHEEQKQGAAEGIPEILTQGSTSITSDFLCRRNTGAGM